MHADIIEKDSIDNSKWEATRRMVPMRFNRLVLLRSWASGTTARAGVRRPAPR